MIKSINYNWFVTPENGEEMSTLTVGVPYGILGFCTHIEEHKPCFEGDKLYYDIYFDSREIHRTFNPNYIIRKEEK